MTRLRCLPMAPSVERVEVFVVTYCCGEGTEAEPAHNHIAVYDMDGNPISNACTYWPNQGAG